MQTFVRLCVQLCRLQEAKTNHGKMMKRSAQKWLRKRQGCLRKVLIIAGALAENILVFGHVWSLMGGGRLPERVAHGGLTVVALRYVHGLL